ncbi:hypothetical protein JAAARDRAFT_125390 [Jaapia argillacea MUCL 33604]|uniref:Uncharacterized protein n=1 Tax=Jaapia argillacea MUCL 33604 TaxID=933084 RepID=A0A067QF72_9AGAM|nr:hypothetical protein JAAARDRAFT_125390 [Jaapia argillacea MUCL 33604]
MTILSLDVATLKRTKNSVIGNPTAKLALSQNDAFLSTLIDCLNPTSGVYGVEPEAEEGFEELRIEAAHVVSSLAHGPGPALNSLLSYHPHRAFIYALSTLPPSSSTALRCALVRGLKTVGCAVADVVGPAVWGLNVLDEGRAEAEGVLDWFFELDVLDIILPFLTSPSSQISTSILLLVASITRTAAHRSTITSWLPLSERQSQILRRRGWEKPGVHSRSPMRMGGWVVRECVGLLKGREVKVQEAALYALASLAKDNHDVAVMLSNPPLDREGPSQSPLAQVMSLCKSRNVDVQLAACLCATHIIRSTPHHPNGHTLTSESAPAMTVLHVINRIIESNNESAGGKTKACFILGQLVRDEKDLCQAAFDRGSVTKLVKLVKSITPIGEDVGEEWEEEEPEWRCALREGCLIGLSTISLPSPQIRRSLVDVHDIFPPSSSTLSSTTSTSSLSASHSSVQRARTTGVRYAACQVVRALSRDVAVLRTSLVDSGLGMRVFEIFRGEEEDRRVVSAALMCVCNLVNDFSPLRSVFVENGLIPRLVQFIHAENPTLKLNSLWALKNLLNKSSGELKKKVMDLLGWDELANMLVDDDPGIQEQALHVTKNLAETEDDIEVVFSEIGSDVLLTCVDTAMNSDSEEVVQQAASLLANLANGSSTYQNYIIAHPHLMVTLRSVLSDRHVEARRPAVSCVVHLARTNARSHKMMREAGVDSTLRKMCDFSGAGVSLSPGGRLGHHLGVEDDTGVRDSAREALHYLDHGLDTSGR